MRLCDLCFSPDQRKLAVAILTIDFLDVNLALTKVDVCNACLEPILHKRAESMRAMKKEPK
jgi:hypothetical protein